MDFTVYCTSIAFVQAVQALHGVCFVLLLVRWIPSPKTCCLDPTTAASEHLLDSVFLPLSLLGGYSEFDREHAHWIGPRQQD
jgi:hypothetical protein